MAKVSGQVFKVYEKEFRGKRLYSIKLEDDPIYYRLNENRCAGVVEPGAFIEFDADPNTDGKSATVRGTPRAVAKPATAAAGPVGGAMTAGTRDASIQYQSARKDALVFVGLALGNGAIKLPAAAAKKLQALEALVDTYTALYLEDINTGGAVTRAQAAAYAQESETETGSDVEDDEE